MVDSIQTAGVLSDKAIIDELGKSIIIVPRPKDKYISGASVDLRLNNVFLVPLQVRRPYFDVSKPIESLDYLQTVIVPLGETFVIHPGEFALASTYEYLELPNYLIGRIEGRSSLGRLGVIVHATAARVDPGFRGRLIFELSNVGKAPVALYSLMRIAALEFHIIHGEVIRPYAGKYLAQSSTLGTRIFDDEDITSLLSWGEEMERRKRVTLEEIWGEEMTKKKWVSMYGLTSESRSSGEAQKPHAD
jgi:dCTP deaminase